MRKEIRNRIKKLKSKKRYGTRLSGIQIFALLLPILLLLIFILVGLLIYIVVKNDSYNRIPATLTYNEYNTGPQIPVWGWGKYTNNKYGISIQYPAEGYTPNLKNCSEKICNRDVVRVFCGSGIKTEPLTRSSTFISLDNMLGIIVNDYNGPIDQFIKSQGGNPSDFKLQNENIKGSDAAVYATLTNQNGMTPPIPIITTPAYIIRKGNYIYQIAPLQNPGSKSGCLPPAGTNSNSFKSTYWNIPESISFN